MMALPVLFVLRPFLSDNSDSPNNWPQSTFEQYSNLCWLLFNTLQWYFFLSEGKILRNKTKQPPPPNNQPTQKTQTKTEKYPHNQPTKQSSLWPFWDPHQTVKTGSLRDLLHSPPGAGLSCSGFWTQNIQPVRNQNFLCLGSPINT